MKLEYFILGTLKLKPRTGYELKSHLDGEGRFMRPRTPLSQIYTTLKRMTEDGWLEFDEELRDGKPDLKIYRVTPDGEAALREWLMAPHEPTFRFQDREFLGKLAYSFLIDAETTLQHCRTELAYRKDHIANFRGRDRTVEVDPSSGLAQPQVQAVFNILHEYGKESIDHYVAWLERTIQQLEAQMEENKT